MSKIFAIAELERGYPILVEKVTFATRLYYYYIAHNGTRSYKYRSLDAAQKGIKANFGHLAGFRLLDLPTDLLAEDKAWRDKYG